MKFLKKILNFIPLIYVNATNSITLTSYVKYSINTLYFIHFCKYYKNYLLNTLDFLLNIKIKFMNYIEYITQDKNDFTLIRVDLYYALNSYDDVTQIFSNLIKDKIDKSIIENIYKAKKYSILDNSDIRLKIYFRYKSNPYILYFSYSQYNYIPYPFYSEQILNDYREDYILPLYNKRCTNNILYTLFSMESKDIQNIIINDVNYSKDSTLYKYVNMIQTPFNDFGILYKCPVKLIWLLCENNIDIDKFKNFELQYLNMYFDEDCFDVFEHKISINTEDSYNIEDSNNTEDSYNIEDSNNTEDSYNIEDSKDELSIFNDNILISERMKYILNKKINYE